MPRILTSLRARHVAAGLLLPILASGCARAEPPPGHSVDLAPPQVARVFPDSGAVVPGLDDPVRFGFNEPIQNPEQLARELFASPAYRYEVEPGLSSIEMRPEGGWREDVVYVVRLPSGISDLLQNATTEPIELVFSTGPPVTDSRIRGRLLDRVTGEPVIDGRVLFLPEDTIPYTAVSDTGGRFSLPAVPPAEYLALGFLDQNRNLRLDRDLEPYDSARVVLEGPEAVADVELLLAEPDTTPPAMFAAEAVDSLTLRLEFSDFLRTRQPEDASVAVEGGLEQAPRRVMDFEVGEPEHAAPGAVPPDTAVAQDTTAVRDTAAARDTAATPDTALGPDTAAAAADTAAARDTAAGRDTAAAPDTAAARPLPSRVVTVRLAAPLTEGEWRVRARGFVNLRGLTGGGDTTFVYTPPPDTLGAEIDPAREP